MDIILHSPLGWFWLVIP